MFGKNKQQKEREARRKENKKQRKAQQRQRALQVAQNDGSGAEVLNQLSIIDDVPGPRGETLDAFVSRIVSTTKLSTEDIRSDEWVREYIILLHKSQFPPEDGLTGHSRAYAMDDKSAKREPLDSEEKAKIEAFKHVSGQAVHRSEDGFATKEGTRTIAESIARDETADESAGGGLMGKLGLK